MWADGGEMLIVPAWGEVTPASMRSSVVLPAPLGPTSPITSPGATTRFRSAKSSRSPCPAETPFACTVALMSTFSQRTSHTAVHAFLDQTRQRGLRPDPHAEQVQLPQRTECCAGGFDRRFRIGERASPVNKRGDLTDRTLAVHQLDKGQLISVKFE